MTPCTTWRGPTDIKTPAPISNSSFCIKTEREREKKKKRKVKRSLVIPCFVSSFSFYYSAGWIGLKYIQSSTTVDSHQICHAVLLKITNCTLSSHLTFPILRKSVSIGRHLSLSNSIFIRRLSYFHDCYYVIIYLFFPIFGSSYLSKIHVLLIVFF